MLLMVHRRARMIAVLSAPALTVLIAAGVAATNWGGPRDSGKHCNEDPVVSQCLNDPASSNISVIIEGSIDSQIGANLRWSMLNYTQVTDVNIFETDVGEPTPRAKVRAAYYTGTWWSAGACEYSGLPTIYGGSEASHTRWCRPQVIRYNLNFRDSKFPGDTAQRDVSCHELGHVLGLRHATSSTGDASWSNSCMVNASQTKTTTTTHDRSHVNAYY